MRRETVVVTELVCGCDVGSTYGKAVIMDSTGAILGSSIVRSKMDPESTAQLAIETAGEEVEAFSSIGGLAYLVGTGYGRNYVPTCDLNVSEISCHAMGVHLTNPAVRTIIDIGGQDIKGIMVDGDGSVRHFSMNDKCAAGTGRYFENMARAFEMDLPAFCELALQSNSPTPISSQCTVFAESEVISLLAQKKRPADIAAGIQASVSKRCYTLLKTAGIEREVTMAGGCAKNRGLKRAMDRMLGFELVTLDTDPQLMGAIGACEFARRKALASKFT